MGTLPYDSKIKYLENSTGLEVIDTGLYASNYTSLYVKLSNNKTTTNRITGASDRIGIGYGWTTSPRLNMYGMNLNSVTNTLLFVQSSYGYSGSSSVYNSFGSINILEIKGLGTTIECYVNNTRMTYLNNVTNFTTPVTLTYFCKKDSNGNFIKCDQTRYYEFKMYEGETLVRDMIPVRVGLTGYMYDRISGLLFGNVGSGNFVLGPDIYTQEVYSLDYIKYFRRRLMLSYVENYNSYLTFEAIEDTDITLVSHYSLTRYIGNISYSINGGPWISVSPSNNVWTFPTVHQGGKIRFKGNATRFGADDIDLNYTHFTSTGMFNVYGDPWSLYFGDNFKETNTYTSVQNLASMFYNCTKLVSAEHLLLKAQTLLTQTYSNMFEGCTNLVKAPKIHATTVDQYSCYSMFFGCTSLIDVPDLEITNFNGANSCRAMFAGCTSLQKAPALPAISFPSRRQGYYLRMFNGCTSLNYIKSLHTNMDSSSYTNGNTYQWVKNVSSSGTFVKNINANWTVTGVSSAPSNWNILYFDPDTEKYYLSDKTTECDELGNVI